MSRILHIETTTRVCSVGVSDRGRILSLREDHSKEYSHSALLTVFMEEVLRESGTKPADLSAVAVSQGPGSYTGLRIGVSAAKGFSYALDIPLIAVDTMRSMVHCAREASHERILKLQAGSGKPLYCPMIDARRMEVYYAVFRHDMTEVLSTRAQVIDKATFAALLDEHTMVFFGDGAEKCTGVITGEHAVFLPDVFPSVKGMVNEAEEKFRHARFVDVAYFEPYYLKDFVAGKPSVKGLNP